MARGRFLSDTVAKDLKLNSLSVEAELVYLLTIPHLDRDGLIEGDTDILFGTVCPKRRQFIDRMGEFIQEWVHVGLVACYDSDNGPVLWFKGFAKNQLGIRYDRETPSKFPPPPMLTPVDSVPPVSDIPPDTSDNCSPHVRAGARPEFQVKDQVEVKEGDRARMTEPPQPAPTPPPFLSDSAITQRIHSRRPSPTAKPSQAQLRPVHDTGNRAQCWPRTVSAHG